MANEFPLAIATGASSIACGYIAMINGTTYTNTRAAVLEKMLTTASSITPDIYNAAEKATAQIASGNLYTGIVGGILCGITGAITIHYATKHNTD
jgi:hypothetical protein